MHAIKILMLLATILSAAALVTPASACPADYHACGVACCPGR